MKLTRMFAPSFVSAVSLNNKQAESKGSGRLSVAKVAMLGIAALVCGAQMAEGQAVANPTTPANFAFGVVSLGSSQTTTVTFAFSTSTAVSTVSILMQGATGKDYIAPSPNSSTTLCTAKTYTSGQSCTVDVVFSPLAVGQRIGAVVLADAGGNALQTVYLSGYGNGAVLGYGSQTVTTVAGNGTVKPFSYSPTNPSPTATGIGAVAQVAFDGTGNMYIAGTNNGTVGSYIWKVTPGGVISPFAGTGTACAGGNAQAGTCPPFSGFTSPVTTTSPLSIQINEAFGIAVDALGNVWWVDPSNDQIYKENAAGTSVQRIQNANYNATPVTSGNLYSNVTVSLPTAITFDGAGNLYLGIQQNLNNTRPNYTCVLKVAPDGTITNVAGNPSVAGGSYSGNGGAATSAVLSYISSMAFDPSGNLYLADDGNGQVYRVDTSGNIHLFAGTGSTADNTSSLPVWGSGTTSATLATTLQFVPLGVASDAAGNIYITDVSSILNYRILLVTPAGFAYIYAGAGATGETDGSLSASAFTYPWGLTFDGQGNLYVADSRLTGTTGGNVRKIGPSGGNTASLVFPTATNVGSSDTTDNPKSVTLTNVGSAALALTTPVTGKNPSVAAGFAVNAASTCPSPSATPTGTLAVGASCAYAVDFKPVAAGAASGALVLSANIAGGTASIGLSGTGVQAVDHFTLTGLPTSIGAGAGMTGTVTAYSDAAGLTVATSYTGPITFTSTDTIAVLPASVTMVNGVASNVSLTLRTSGVQTITAVGAGGSPTVTSGNITVRPAALRSVVVVSGTPQGALISSAFTSPLVFMSVDAYGNAVPSTTVTFTAPTTGASATLSATSVVTGSDGQGSVTATANGVAGTYAIGLVQPNLGPTGAPPVHAQQARIAYTLTNQVPPFYTVTTAVDDATGVAANCTEGGTADANCSLRDALAAAAITATSAIPITINFSPSIILSGHTNVNLILTNGPLSLPSNTTVSGIVSTQYGNVVGVSGTNGAAASNVFVVGTGVTGAALLNLSIGSGTSLTATDAGGVVNAGSLTITNCELANNHASAAGATAIYNTGTLTMLGSTVRGNTSNVAGSRTIFSSGTLNAINSTIAGNTAQSGTVVIAGVGTATLTQVTIAGNTGTTVGGLIANNGSVVRVVSSIIAGNTGTTPDVLGTLTSQSGVVNTNPTILTGVTSALGPYGGQTLTVLPLPGGPALCAQFGGGITGATATDQRGFARTTTYNGFNTCLDAGAVQTSYNLVFTQQPTNVAVGASISPSPVVQLQENGAAVALSGYPVQLTPLGVAAQGTLTVSTASNGSATFPGISFASAQTLEKLQADTQLASLPGVALVGASVRSNTFNIVIPVDHFVWSGLPTTVVAGATFRGTITAYADAAGLNVATNYNGPVAFSGGSGTGLPFPQPMVNGVLTVTNFSLRTVGPQTITVADASGSPSTVSPTITVTPGAVSAVYDISGDAQSAAIGGVFASPLVFEARDGYGNVVPGATVVLTVPASGASATLSATSLVTGSNGRGSVTATANATVGGPYLVSLTQPVVAGIGGVHANQSLKTTFALTNTQAATSVVVTPSASAIVYGQPVTVVAAITPASVLTAVPTGNVTFFDGAAAVASNSAVANAAQSLTFGLPAVGTHAYSAIYLGDTNFAASAQSAAASVVVSKATPILTGPAGTVFIPFGQGGNFNVSIAGQFAGPGIATPSGALAASVGGGLNTSLASTVSGNVTTFTFPSNGSVQTYVVTVAYPGDANYAATTLTVNVQVGQITPTVTFVTPGASIVYGSALGVFAAATNGSTVVSGTVSYTATPAGGSASAVTAATVLAAGNYTLTANFVPTDTATYKSATGTAALTVTQAAPAIAWATPAAIVYGTPLGATQLNASATGVGGAALPGAFTYTPAAGAIVAAGASQSLGVSFAPTDAVDYSVATKTVTIVVNKASSTLTGPVTQPALVTFGQTGTVLVNVSGQFSGAGISVPSGSITHTIAGGTAQTAAISGGVGNITVPNTLASGLYSVTVSYSGDVNYAAATGITVQVQVGPQPQTITFGALSAVTYGVAPIALSATASSALPVAFTVKSGPGTISGNTLTVTGAGAIVIAADQAGSAIWKAATQVLQTLTVNKATPAAALATTGNIVLTQNAITFTATVSSAASVPTGTVNFLDGATVLGTGTLANGVATFTTSTLAIGSHSVTAVYAGDANFNGATSSAQSETIEDFSLNISTVAGSVTSVTVLPGGMAVYTLTIAPINGTTFPAAVTLTASGLPAGAVATFSPATLAAGSGSTTVTLSISIPQHAMLQHVSPFGKAFAPVALGMLLLPFSRRMRKNARRLARATSLALLLLAGLAATAGLTGCGTTSGFFAQQQQTYNIVVTGTSGTLTHSTTVTLTVE